MYKENEYIELKRELTSGIKKEIIAFANTNGGTVYIGIDDDGTVCGLKNSSKDLEAISGMIREGIKSDLTLYTKIYIERINDKDIILVKVMSGPNKPYYLAEKGIKSSGVFLRHGTASVPASDEMIKKLIQESNKNTFEEEISSNQLLHFEYLTDIFNKKEIELTEEKYKTLNIMNLDNLYTNLGLLLSDECPFTIKCAIYNGKNKMEFKDRKEFSGSLIKQANEVFDFLELFNRTSGKIVGLERVDVRDYPEYALRETLLNAIIHRDYNYSGSILLSLYEDRVEIVSLGGLVKGLNIEDLYSGISETRNPKLANIFFRLKYVESFGTGIGRIIDSYDKSGKEPNFKDTDNTFFTMLPNINYKEKYESSIPSSMTQEEKIVEYLKINKKITRRIIEGLLGISSTRSKIIVNNLIEKEAIERTGTGRNTYYILR